MSGGNGGPIIVGNGASVLRNPLVHGNLPDWVKAMVDPILAKDTSDWTQEDKVKIAYAYSWALCHLQ